MNLRHEVPFNIIGSEEKYLKFLSKRAFKAVLVSTSLGFVIFMILKTLGYLLAGIIVIVVIDVITYALRTIQIPMESNLSGGGLYLDTYLLKKYLRRGTKIIYVKGYDRVHAANQ